MNAIFAVPATLSISVTAEVSISKSSVCPPSYVAVIITVPIDEQPIDIQEQTTNAVPDEISGTLDSPLLNIEEQTA